jgi:hypothetical protein
MSELPVFDKKKMKKKVNGLKLNVELGSSI